MSEDIQEGQIVYPKVNGKRVWYATPLDAVLTPDGHNLKNYIDSRPSSMYYYQDNETFTVSNDSTLSPPAYISEDSLSVYLSLPLPKNIQPDMTFTITNMKISIRCINTYIEQNYSVPLVLNTHFKIKSSDMIGNTLLLTLGKQDDSTWKLQSNKSTVAPNNTPVSVQIREMDIIFSGGQQINVSNQQLPNFISIEQLQTILDTKIQQILQEQVPDLVKQSPTNLKFDGTEQEIGTWFGKKLYQKTIAIPAISGGSGKTIASGITNRDKIVDVRGTLYINEGTVPLTFHNWEATNHQYFCYINTGNGIDIKTRGANVSGGYVTLRYTKTTT